MFRTPISEESSRARHRVNVNSIHQGGSVPVGGTVLISKIYCGIEFGVVWFITHNCHSLQPVVEAVHSLDWLRIH